MRLRTGLLPLHRHASAPVSMADPQDSHTPQSYRAADAEYSGHADELVGRGSGHRFEAHAQLGHPPQRMLTVRSFCRQLPALHDPQASRG